jgi:hypothetical protein
MFYEDSMSSFLISFKCSLDASKGIVCVCHLEKIFSIYVVKFALDIPQDISVKLIMFRTRVI